MIYIIFGLDHIVSYESYRELYYFNNYGHG